MGKHIVIYLMYYGFVLLNYFLGIKYVKVAKHFSEIQSFTLILFAFEIIIGNGISNTELNSQPVYATLLVSLSIISYNQGTQLISYILI